MQLLQSLRIHVGAPHIELQVQAFLQRIGAFHHHVQGLDAVDSDVALCQDLGPGVVEVNADKNIELIGQDVVPSPGRLRRCSLVGCDAAASSSVGRVCDARNTSEQLILIGTANILL